MADIRDLETKFHKAIKDWVIDTNRTEEHIIESYEEDKEIEELAKRLAMIVKHHKGDK